MNENFSLNIRIYYEDTDAGGVVYYSNYLKFAERARAEWLRELGFEQRDLWQTHNAGFVVRRCSVDYHASAYLDDLLEITCMIEATSKSTLTLHQQVKRDGILLTTIHTLLVCVNDKLRPRRIPEDVMNTLITNGSIS